MFLFLASFYFKINGNNFELCRFNLNKNPENFLNTNNNRMSFIGRIEVHYYDLGEQIRSVKLSTLQFRMFGNFVVWLEIGTLPLL